MLTTTEREGDRRYDAGEHDEPGPAGGADQHHVGRVSVGAASSPAAGRRAAVAVRRVNVIGAVSVVVVVDVSTERLIDDQGQVECRRQRRMSAISRHHSQFYYLPTAHHVSRISLTCPSRHVYIYSLLE